MRICKAVYRPTRAIKDDRVVLMNQQPLVFSAPDRIKLIMQTEVQSHGTVRGFEPDSKNSFRMGDIQDETKIWK